MVEQKEQTLASSMETPSLEKEWEQEREPKPEREREREQERQGNLPKA